MSNGSVECNTGLGNHFAATIEYGDMLEMGILDAIKVTRSALQDASIAGLMLTTEAVFVENPEDKPAEAPGGIDGML